MRAEVQIVRSDVVEIYRWNVAVKIVQTQLHRNVSTRNENINSRALELTVLRTSKCTKISRGREVVRSPFTHVMRGKLMLAKNN